MNIFMHGNDGLSKRRKYRCRGNHPQRRHDPESKPTRKAARYTDKEQRLSAYAIGQRTYRRAIKCVRE